VHARSKPGFSETRSALTADALSAWEDFRIEVEEYREADGERVLVLWNFKGRGKASGGN
jgi:hypothetical protein